MSKRGRRLSAVPASFFSTVSQHPEDDLVAALALAVFIGLAVRIRSKLSGGGKKDRRPARSPYSPQDILLEYALVAAPAQALIIGLAVRIRSKLSGGGKKDRRPARSPCPL